MRAIACIVFAGCGRIGFGAAGGDVGAGGDAIADYVTTVLADHPLAYYRLDEPSGTIAHDSSGHGLDGQYAVAGGTLAYGMPGALARDPDTAIELAGDGTATASMTFPPAAYAFGGDFTLEGWVIPAPTPAGGINDAFILWETYQVSGFRTGWDHSQIPLLWTSQSGVTTGTPDVNSMVAMGSGWSYLVFTRAGSLVSIYLDGVLVGSGTPGFVVPLATGANSLGSDNGMPAGTTYDEVAIYDRALPADRIAAHYAAAR